MTKICGVVGGREDIDPASVLRCMYDASWHDNYIRREVWHDSRAGLGHFNVGAVNTEPQPSFSADGDRAIVYCGKIFDYASLKNDLVSRGVHFELENNDAEFMLHFLDHGGRDRLSRLNGIFSLACWDSRQKKLILINDRYGLRPLYYYHHPASGVLVFSSDLRGVIESGLVERKINWRAATVFLHFGYHLGEDTFFADVELLPPASVLEFANNTIRITRYWNMADILINESITYPQALQKCGDLFAQAMQRRIAPEQGKTLVLLSGGLDSGRIAAELKRQGCRFATYTSRGFTPHDNDGPVAAQVAKALGLENTFVNLPARHFMNDYFPRVAALLDYETRLHQPYLPLVEALPQDGKINFDGIGGDVAFNAVLRSSEFTDPEEFLAAQARPLDQLAAQLIVERHNFSVFTPQINRHLSESNVVETVRRELGKFAGTPHQLTCWYLSNRTRRAIALASLKLISLKAESFMPFYDNDLFDFVMSLPPLMKIKNSLRNDMTQQRYPEFYRIFQSRNNIPDQGDDFGYYRQKRELWRWNTRRYFLEENWIFRNSQALPRLLRDLAIGRLQPEHNSYLYNFSFLIFYEWLKKYFPRGRGLLDLPAE